MEGEGQGAIVGGGQGAVHQWRGGGAGPAGDYSGRAPVHPHSIALFLEASQVVRPAIGPSHTRLPSVIRSRAA